MMDDNIKFAGVRIRKIEVVGTLTVQKGGNVKHFFRPVVDLAGTPAG